MSSDLLTIARSGATASRAALDVTAQNIANASSEGYVRRSLGVEELAAASAFGRNEVSLSGVRISGLVRNVDAFRQAEVRRTGSDAARASAELQGLESIESAIEQSRVYESIVGMESALQQLVADPSDEGLRAAALESMRTMAETFNIADAALASTGEGLRLEAQDGVKQVNLYAAELARVNLQLVRATNGSSSQVTLLDQRDALLQKLSEQVDVTTTFAADNTVTVRIGGASGPLLVNGNVAGTMAMATNADGTLTFTVDSAATTPASGSLAGKAQALDELAGVRARLDALALSIADTVNAAQASGTDLDGNAGATLFSATGAGDIALVATSGRAIATAPSGATAGSRDSSNLAALRTALTTANPAGSMDSLLLDVSSTIAGRQVTAQALDAIAATARSSLQAQTGVDLDQEAVNLVRFQQAFQASSRVMQVASDIFDSLLAIR